MAVREYTADMGEISGFGGSYEAACRAMVLAGVQWLEDHPEADPHFHGFKGIYGICMEDNEDAKALTKAMMDAKIMDEGVERRCGDDATGAMHQASVTHVFYIKRNGWEKYCEEMRKPEKQEEAEEGPCDSDRTGGDGGGDPLPPSSR